MTSEDLEREAYRRHQVIDVLQLTASGTKQLEYQRNVPIANVPSEELCEALPDPFPWRVEDIADHPAWRRLGKAAGEALAVMLRRGRTTDPYR